MGYEGGNVPKEMADCAMADILSTIIIRRAAFVFVVSNERTCVSCFFGDFWSKKIFGGENFSRERETKERSQRDFENSHSSTRTIIIYNYS